MNSIIKGHNMELTAAIREYAEQKLGSIISRLENKSDSSLEVELGITTKHHKHGDMYKAKALLIVGSRRIHVESVTDEMYKSIDELKDKLDDELAHSGDRKRSIMRNIARRFKTLIKRN